MNPMYCLTYGKREPVSVSIEGAIYEVNVADIGSYAVADKIESVLRRVTDSELTPTDITELQGMMEQYFAKALGDEQWQKAVGCDYFDAARYAQLFYFIKMVMMEHVAEYGKQAAATLSVKRLQPIGCVANVD